jgi:parallel beta-helix repeat protein
MPDEANHIRKLLFALFLLATSCTAVTGKIIYVDDDAIAEFDGSSWAFAYLSLQEAIAEVLPGDEIWVAKGVYRPDDHRTSEGLRGGGRSASGDREATFELINGVTFKGGYAGYGKPEPNARNINLYETILSGDLDANDVDVNSPSDLLNESSREDNSYFVVTGSGNSILDGFTITGGTSAGLFNEYSTVRILNCTFRENSAETRGGGIYNYRSNPILINCTFTKNSANDGGGIYNYQSYPDLTKCTFIENSVEYGGGGIYNEESYPTLANCTFIANSAHYGGGMYNEKSGPALTKCTFLCNLGNNYGGAMYNTDESNPILNNCVFTGNSANNYGACLSNNNSSPALTNCTFTGNSAPNGNALACNSRQQRHGGTISLINCILWDGGNEIWNNDRSTFIISYSNLQGGWPGEGNIDADPLFVDPHGPDNIPGTEDYNLQLAPLSPCIDSGDPDFVSEPNETDLNGNRRIIKGRIDMGAYEFQPIIYVDDDNRLETEQSSITNEPFQDGTELHPFNDIHKAVNAAEDGTTILVKPGTYSRIDFMGKAITIAGIEGTAVIKGQFEGRSQHAVTFHADEGPGSVLKNFVIRDSGMAISLNYGSRPTISNITIVDNGFGIAAYENSNPDISNCIFWNNTDGDLFQCRARYSCFKDQVEGHGNISGDPLFVDAANGDYHLKSEGWRWNIDSESWTYDNVTSICIDAGNPYSPIGEEPTSVPRDPDNIYGVNRYINMGAFGGTSQASMPPLGWVLP